MSRSLATNAGSLDSLKVLTRCGRSLWARQIRCTELMLIPVAAAMAAAVQRIASPGGSVGVRATTRPIVAWDKGRDARRPGPVAQQPGHALAHEPLLPAPDARLRLAGPAHDLARPQAVRRGQDDPRPPDVLLRAVAVRR